MKKKNILLSILAIVFVAMTALCITSCDKDDDSSNGNGGNTPTNSIVGTWKGNIGEDEYEVAIVLKIRNDNTGTVTLTEEYYNDSEKYDLTYKMTSNDEGYAIVEFDDYYSGMEYERYDYRILLQAFL